MKVSKSLVIGAGGTAPNQSLGAEHSQPFHAYIMVVYRYTHGIRPYQRA